MYAITRWPNVRLGSDLCEDDSRDRNPTFDCPITPITDCRLPGCLPLPPRLQSPSQEPRRHLYFHRLHAGARDWSDHRDLQCRYGVLLQPLPYPESDRLVAVGRSITAARSRGSPTRTSTTSATGTAPHSAWRSTTRHGDRCRGGTSRRGARSRRHAGLLQDDGRAPSIGRRLAPTTRVSAPRPAVLVSHAYWTQYLVGATAFFVRTCASRIASTPSSA